MHEQSSNHSERSNFFALSSESSRNSQPNFKKQHYSAFIRKVKHLLEAENDDLDEVYRKVEIIVRKYFHDHKIVEFSDMYGHISALKNNNLKMNGIVALLERRIMREGPKHNALDQSRQSNKSSKSKNRNRDDETQTNFKETGRQSEGAGRQSEGAGRQSKRAGRQNEGAGRQSKQEHTGQAKLVDYKQSLGSVVTSLHNYQLTKATFHKSEAITNPSEQSESTKSAKKKQHSPSPDRLNSSFEDYQFRNKQYEQKVRELLGEIREIKESMREQRQIQPLQQFGYDSAQYRMQLNRGQVNREELNKEQEIRSETSIIDSCLQKNLTSDTKQTLEQERELKKELEMKQRLQSIKEKSNESISNKTIGSNSKIEPASKLPLLESTQPAGYNSPPITYNSPSPKHNPSNTSKELSVQQKKQLLLKQAENITKQLSQLKSFASQLQIEPSQLPADPLDIHEKTQINIFAAIERNNNQILERISPTISKPMIESNISSSKHIKPTEHFRQSVYATKLQKMADSSAFSFSDNQSHPIVEMRPIARSNHNLVSGLMSNEQNLRPSSYGQNIRSKGVIVPNSQFQQLSTIRYIYDPYASGNGRGSANGNGWVNARNNSSIHFGQPSNVPQHLHNASGPQQPQHNASGLHHNHSQTSIMRGRLQESANKVVRIGYDDRYGHLRPRPAHSASNIQESQVKLLNNLSEVNRPLVNRPLQNNSSMLRKKGINMLSPHPFLHR